MAVVGGGGVRPPKDGKGYTAFRVVNATLLLLMCAVVLYPFVNIVAQAFSSEGHINAGQVNLVPRGGFNLTTFKVVLSDDMFWTNYKNTVVYTVVGTVIAMALTTTYAYALSKKHLKGRTFFIGIAVLTMFFNGGLIPNYVLITTLGFKDTIWAIVLPNAISVFNLLVMKSFFENFPDELEEAAAIDGMSTYGVFFRIVLPLSKAVLATMVLFYAVAFWNSWFSAYLYMTDAANYPVTVYLRNLMAGGDHRDVHHGWPARQHDADRLQRAVRDDAAHGPADRLPLPVHPEVLRVGRDARRGEAMTAPGMTAVQQ